MTRDVRTREGWRYIHIIYFPSRIYHWISISISFNFVLFLFSFSSSLLIYFNIPRINVVFSNNVVMVLHRRREQALGKRTNLINHLLSLLNSISLSIQLTSSPCFIFLICLQQLLLRMMNNIGLNGNCECYSIENFPI